MIIYRCCISSERKNFRDSCTTYSYMLIKIKYDITHNWICWTRWRSSLQGESHLHKKVFPTMSYDINNLELRPKTFRRKCWLWLTYDRATCLIDFISRKHKKNLLRLSFQYFSQVTTLSICREISKIPRALRTK